MTSYKARTSEYMFAAECSRRGLVYCFPSMEAIPFDAVIVNKNGKEFKVQVKSSFLSEEQMPVRVDIRKPNGSRRYALTDYDYLVIYLDCRKSFYIIPHADILDQCHLTLNKDRDKYLNNWEPLLETL